MKNSSISFVITCLVNSLLFLALIRLNRNDTPVGPQQVDPPAPVIIRERARPEPRIVSAPQSVSRPAVFSPSPEPLPTRAFLHTPPPMPAPMTVMLPRRPPPLANPSAAKPTPYAPVIDHTSRTPSVQAHSTPYDAEDIDAPPRGIGNREPRYPEIARVRNIEGSVTVKLLIDKTGRVKKSRILDVKGHPSFGQTVLRMVDTWRFTIPMYEGKPVDVWAVKTIKFQLD